MRKRKSKRNIEVKGKKKHKVETEKNEKTFNCHICMDSKPMEDCFKIKKLKGRGRARSTCRSDSHRHFCIACISKYIEVKVKENVSSIRCPDVDCRKNIRFDSCDGIIPKSVLDSWEDVLSKSTISSMPILYCPFENCSAPLFGTKPKSKAAKVMLAKCPHCREEFCVGCMVPWHQGKKCNEFIKENEEKANDELLIDLAKEKKWKRCPQCKFYIEKISGCDQVRCRCNYSFNYDMS